jgi:transcription termination factor Rho
VATSQNIEDMKLPELKELAKQMRLRGTSTMRKPELLATLQAARSGGQAPAGVTVRGSKPKSSAAAKKASDSQDAQGNGNSAAGKAQAEAREDESAKAVASLTPFAPAAPAASPAQSSASSAVDSASKGASQTPVQDEHPAQDHVRSIRRRVRKSDESANLLDELDLALPEPKRNEGADKRRQRNTAQSDLDQPRRRHRTTKQEEEHDPHAVRDLNDILASLPVQDHEDAGEGAKEDAHEHEHEREFVRRTRDCSDRNERNERNEHSDRNDHNDRNDRNNGSDRRQRHMRGRDRDYGNNNANTNNRDERDERRDNRREEASDDLVPVAGIVDVLDSYAFVRTSGYLPGPNDVYVSMGQVKKYGLRKGDAVQGSIRTPREGDRRNQRQKFVPLQSIDTINGMSIEDSVSRPHFSKLTPLYPQERLKQETTPNRLTGRLVDIVAPIGKGQRGLIVSPPKAGKTITLQNIANSIATNNPEVHLMVVLVDERPEEVTDMERTVQGEVISSTFDRPASDHTTVAELAIERAKRLVELGQDVVVLLDSMTRLARAYNISAPASGRILSGGVDAQALYPPKKFFGAARNIENGGSLTIISSALVETGSKMDEVIFEEFKGTGNMELRLSRELADKRLFPAIDVNASGTRREELITASDELPVIYRLRRLLGGLEPEQAYQTLVPRLKKTATNRDFLTAIMHQSGLN